MLKGLQELFFFSVPVSSLATTTSSSSFFSDSSLPLLTLSGSTHLASVTFRVESLEVWSGGDMQVGVEEKAGGGRVVLGVAVGVREPSLKFSLLLSREERLELEE